MVTQGTVKSSAGVALRYVNSAINNAEVVLREQAFRGEVPTLEVRRRKEFLSYLRDVLEALEEGEEAQILVEDFIPVVSFPFGLVKVDILIAKRSVRLLNGEEVYFEIGRVAFIYFTGDLNSRKLSIITDNGLGDLILNEDGHFCGNLIKI